MSLRLTCSGCGSSLNVPAELAGRRIRCKQCQTILTVPGSSATAASRPTSSSPPMVVLLDDVDEEAQDEDEELEESSSSLGLVAVVVGLSVLVTLLIGVGIWWFWPRGAAHQAQADRQPPPQPNRINPKEDILKLIQNLGQASRAEQKEFLQVFMREDINNEFFVQEEIATIVDNLLPLLRDQELRPLVLQLLHQKTSFGRKTGPPWQLRPGHWAQLAKLDIKSLSPEEKRHLLGIIQNQPFSNQDPNYQHLAKVLPEDPDLKDIALKSNFLQKPASFEERMDLEKHVEKLRGKPPAKEATSLLAGILRSLHTQRAKEANALIQAIRPYLDDPDLRATYLARVILLRTATPEHILDVLSYSELPKLKFTDLAEFHLDSTDLPDIFAGDESKTLITKYLADPAVQKKLLELAKSSDPKFQETLPKLLCHADRLPGELIDTLFSRNFQANAETISRWLDSYSTDPIPVSSAALTILARTKDEAVRKAIVNWFQNCKPSFLDRQRLQMRVRERCEELMKDPDAAPNVVPVLILFARFPQEWKQYAKHPHPRVRHLVLERLAEDPRTGVEALIPHLTIPQDQEKAKELLRQMFDKHGAIAIEPTILSQLNLASKTNPIIILPLLEILRDKGTVRCLPALQLFTKYPNQQIAKMAQAAIVEIKKRGL